ncbi:MAG TPA: hypothetical protein VD948_02705 [Rhodothermales bacterium]|nr:hypothetical protein [Rhodothermales bacterium]
MIEVLTATGLALLAFDLAEVFGIEIGNASAAAIGVGAGILAVHAARWSKSGGAR